MGKIDKVKEILTTLRVAMSVTIGVLVLTISSIIKRYDDGNIDLFFWLGICFSIVTVLVITIIIINISKKTNEIGDL